MWKKPWSFAEGFFIGGGLLLAGLILQDIVGPVNWDRLAFPANGVVLAFFLLLIGTLYALRKRVYAIEWMMHNRAAVPAIAWALGLTLLMGLTTQTERGGIPWISRMVTFWPFVLAYSWLLMILGLASLNHILHFRLRDIPFLLNHMGLFLAIATATLGSADLRQLQMSVTKGYPEWKAEDEKGNLRELDFAIDLHSFSIEEYPPEQAKQPEPKRYASDITVITRDGRELKGIVEVNRPMKVDGWKIYQYGFDGRHGNQGDTSIFSLVRDPWLPLVYTGIFMMLAGALCLLFILAPNRRDPDPNDPA